MKIIQVGEFGGWFSPYQYVAHGYTSEPEYVPRRGLFSKPAKTPRWKVRVGLSGDTSLVVYTYNELEAMGTCQKITRELEKVKC